MDAAHTKHAIPDVSPAALADALPHWGEGIQIDACQPLERIVVRTRNSVYDLVVSGREGDVLVRGGRLFPEFRQAQLVGATAGCHTVKLFGVYVGLCLELFVDGHSVTTSPVLEISRPPAAEHVSTHAH